MSELERLLEGLSIQAATINDLTNAIHDMAVCIHEFAESSRLLAIAISQDEEIETSETYLDGKTPPY